MNDVSYSFADISPRERYKILVATVVPRPIALVTTLSPEGVLNAAPFSFFNVFSEDPALIVLGIQHRAGGGRKDTSRNIAAAASFVVNLVDEDIAEAMNICAVDFPPEISEVEMAGLTAAPSLEIPVPRLAQAPFSLECRRFQLLSFGPDRELLIGEVLRVHARAGLFDPVAMRVRTEAYHPVGRMEGNAYTRQRDRFDLRRQTYAEFLAEATPQP